MVLLKKISIIANPYNLNVPGWEKAQWEMASIRLFIAAEARLGYDGVSLSGSPWKLLSLRLRRLSPDQSEQSNVEGCLVGASCQLNFTRSFLKEHFFTLYIYCWSIPCCWTQTIHVGSKGRLMLWPLSDVIHISLYYIFHNLETGSILIIRARKILAFQIGPPNCSCSIQGDCKRNLHDHQSLWKVNATSWRTTLLTLLAMLNHGSCVTPSAVKILTAMYSPTSARKTISGQICEVWSLNTNLFES